MNKSVPQPLNPRPTLFDWAARLPARECLQVRRAPDGVTFEAPPTLNKILRRWDRRAVLDIKFGDNAQLPLEDVIFDTNNPESFFRLCQKVRREGNALSDKRGYAARFKNPVILITPHWNFSNHGHMQGRLISNGQGSARAILSAGPDYTPFLNQNGYAQMIMIYGMKICNAQELHWSAEDVEPYLEAHIRVCFNHQIQLPLDKFPAISRHASSRRIGDAHQTLEV